MDQLREIKKSRLLESESFTYMISSQEKLNNSNISWEFDFGGFSEGYDNYKVEVLNMAHNGFVLSSNVYYMMICDGLANNGYFFRKKLNRSECVLGIMPLTAVGDAYIQTSGASDTQFNVINCRIRKRIRIYFTKPDFSLLADTVDINVGTTETSPGVFTPNVTQWFLTLKMTPIVNY